MLFNQVNVIPTPETMVYLRSIFSGCPIELDFDEWHCTLITTSDGVAADPSRTYLATVQSAKLWYDSYIGTTSFILTLESRDLMQRALEFAQQGVARSFYDFYVPYMKIVKYMPPLDRTRRRFVLATANLFASNDTALEFGSEYATTVDLSHAPDFDYHQVIMNEFQNVTLNR